MVAYFLTWLHSHFLFTPPIPKTQFNNQTIIVTGSNVGLGLEAARYFVRLNAEKVILAVRNLEKGEAAKTSIEASEKRKGVVEVWHLDLSSYTSVKQFATKAQGLKRLDVLMENAGIVTYKWSMAEDNESTITINVVSTFLLALLMLPKLRETSIKYNATTKLNIVASFVHWMTPFKERSSQNIFETLAEEEKADMQDRYNVSKMLDILLTRELAELTTASKKEGHIVVNCMNPGWVVTEIMREWTGMKQAVFRVGRTIVARKTDVGARTLIAAAEAGEESHGQYMDDCDVSRVSPFVTSEEGVQTQKKVWKELSQKLEKIQPGILQSI